MKTDLNTTAGSGSGGSPCSTKFCPNCGSKPFPSGTWWQCGSSQAEDGRMNVTELCKARNEINRLWAALHDIADTLLIPLQYDEVVIAEEVKKLKAASTGKPISLSNVPHHLSRTGGTKACSAGDVTAGSD
jgi:hypothetical protein